MQTAQTLPPAFTPLTAYRRFVTYDLAADPDRPGKTIKRPTDVRTGHFCKVNDPARQYSYAEAAATGRPIGFVFNEADGFWFLDIDGALVNGAWNAQAVELCQALHGAAVEVSQSDTGLHLIGRGTVPPHSCKNIAAGLELYTHDRFVALTGKQAGGSADFDASAAITAIAERYFPPSAGGDIAGWTTEPVPEWDGPPDDAALLRAALASGKRSAAAAFGDAHVSFEDLWTANADALAKRWPSATGPYGASEADAALVSHLAYWTGKNCERIRDLMWQSGLVRQKWEDRPVDYLDVTIMKAVSIVTNVATGRPPPSAEIVVASGMLGDLGNFARVVFDGDDPPAPPRELIKGLLPAEGVTFLGGQSGAGKTFVAVALAVTLASVDDSEFFGHRRRERVGVAIVAAEGMGTLSNRIDAAKQDLRTSGKMPIAYFPLDGDLNKEADLAALRGEMSKIDARFRENFGVRLGAIVIDTVAAAFGIEDENANAEASRIIRALRKIGMALGAAVIAVHHYGKSRDAGLRGASGFRAGADAVISVIGDRNEATGAVRNRSIALAKSRTGEEGPISGFDLIWVRLGRDEDGDEYGSCFVAANSTAPPRRENKEPASATTLRAAFSAVLASHAVDQPQLTGRLDGRAVSVRNLREEFSKRYAPQNNDAKRRADAARKAFPNALHSLAAELQTGRDNHGEEWVWSAL